MNSHHLYEAIDKHTEKPVNKIVCLRKELKNPNKKIYKIAGYIKKSEIDEINGSVNVVKKIALIEINGDERLLINFNKLIFSYVEIIKL
jgi:NifB/MoaA-like Fe-S oxidoreductase